MLGTARRDNLQSLAILRHGPRITNLMNHLSHDDPVLEIEGLEQHLYDPARGERFVVHVRQRLSIQRGSVVALLGPSGCGKTTLLTILGMLRHPSHPEKLARFRMRPRRTGGDIFEYDLKEILLQKQRRTIEQLRREQIGFALQSGELLPALTVRENIAVPLRLNGITGAACWQRVQELLDAFQLRRPTTNGETARSGSRLEYSRVNKLSGGEYQRVALARAIAHHPTLVFVDEPTAALNRELAWGALEQLRALQTSTEAHGATIMITHDEELACAFADMIVRMAPVKGESAGEVVALEPNQATCGNGRVTVSVAESPLPPPPEPHPPEDSLTLPEEAPVFTAADPATPPVTPPTEEPKVASEPEPGENDLSTAPAQENAEPREEPSV